MPKKRDSAVVVALRNDGLAKSLAEKLNLDFVLVDLKEFADTESAIKIDNIDHIKSRLVFLTFKFCFGKSINDQILQFLLLAGQLKIYGASKIVAILPYLPYARQCKDVFDVDDGPFQTVGSLFKSAGIDHVISCELHEELCKKLFSVLLHQINLEDVWAEVLKENFSEEELKNISLVSPDGGGIERVKRLANVFGAPTAFVEKERTDFDKSVALNLVGDVNDKFVILVDDIIDTGLTVSNASEIVLKNGAKKVFGFFCHPILSRDSVKLLEKSSIEKVWVCNTVLLDKANLSSKINILNIDEKIIDFVSKAL